MFVVNIGKALAYLTGGKVVSTQYRVASLSETLAKGSARLSVAYFYSPNWNTRLQPITAAKMDHNLGQAATSATND
jgi:isopenicillin N synthase-like dioxygenase